MRAQVGPNRVGGGASGDDGADIAYAPDEYVVVRAHGWFSSLSAVATIMFWRTVFQANATVPKRLRAAVHPGPVTGINLGLAHSSACTF